jgi:hypothetical protein
MGQRHLQRRQPLAQPQIEVVQRRRPHRHQHLARPRLGRRHLAHLHHLGATVAPQQGRAHRLRHPTRIAPEAEVLHVENDRSRPPGPRVLPAEESDHDHHEDEDQYPEPPHRIGKGKSVKP